MRLLQILLKLTKLCPESWLACTLCSAWQRKKSTTASIRWLIATMNSIICCTNFGLTSLWLLKPASLRYLPTWPLQLPLAVLKERDRKLLTLKPSSKNGGKSLSTRTSKASANGCVKRKPSRGVLLSLIMANQRTLITKLLSLSMSFGRNCGQNKLNALKGSVSTPSPLPEPWLTIFHVNILLTSGNLPPDCRCPKMSRGSWMWQLDSRRGPRCFALVRGRENPSCSHPRKNGEHSQNA